MSLLINDGAEEQASENGYYTAAARYIRAHYAEDVTVESIAAYVGIGRKYLFAIFKRHAGISPKEYLLGYRIKKAASLLEHHDLPVSSVAYSVGYSDSLAFSRMFKLKTGLSPTDYRNKRQNKQ